MNRRVLWILLAVAVTGFGLAAWYLRNRPRPPLPYEVDADARPAAPPVDPTISSGVFESAPKGGTFSGTVVEAEDGAPIAHAQVLLVATSDNELVSILATDADGVGPTQDIPVFGSYRVAARGVTDAKGAFRLSGGEARVVALFAHESGHGLGMVRHMRTAPLTAGPGHQIRLARAGYLEGTVIDHVTRAPVAGADVSIYLQHPANQDGKGTTALTATSSFAVFQAFITQQLGSEIWGIEPRPNDEALHKFSDRDGKFRFGPIMKEVQLEFIVSHREYAWTDGDPEVALEQDNPGTDPAAKVRTRKLRTVVPPGATVERTFELSKGKELSGTVVDDKAVPFADVVVSLEHVAQYTQHYWYRTHTRGAKTDAAGRFRIAGLSYGPYVLTMTHPAFEKKVFQPIPEASDQTYVIPRGGWIDARVTGSPSDRPSFVADLRLVKVAAKAGAGEGVERREHIAVRDGLFSLEKVEPGHYELSMTSGRLVASPVRVEVVAGVGATVELALRGGGGFRLSVVNSLGGAIDPVAAEIELAMGDGMFQRAGMVLARVGVIEAEGLVAGRYRISARAQGYVAGVTEPFDVGAERMTPVPALTLRRAGILKIVSVKDENGRAPVDGAIRSFTIIQGDGSPVAAGALATGTVPVAPGPVVVRVTMEDGRVSETKIDVAEGETASVDVVLAPK